MMIDVIVWIQKVKTGRIVRRWDKLELEDGFPNLRWWTEGNASCDCNRGMFFDQQLTGELDWEKNYPCGEGRYRIMITTPDLKLIYDEGILIQN